MALSRRGAEILAKQTGEEVLTIPYFTPARLKRSQYMMEHELMVTQVGIALEMLSRKYRDLSMKSWETSPNKLGASVRLLTPKGMERVPLVADALFGLEYNCVTSWFLLELDRGTINIGRMRRKFQGYRKWWRNDGPKVRFGIKNIRLLVLVPNEKRLKALKLAANASSNKGGTGFFWFGLHEFADLDHPERLLEKVWQKANDQDGLHSLLTRCPGP